MSSDSLPTRTPAARAAAWLVLAATTGHALAQTAPQRVEVTAERVRVPSTQVTQDVGAAPASATVLDRRDLDRLSVSTYGDMFRNVAGVWVNDYGQGLVAYEIKMRGFVSDHGGDIAFSLDGVPLNITGSQHANGYADLAQLIAETVDRVEIVRGPFSVTSGNHAVAGSVNFYTDRNTPSLVKVDVDSFGRVRVLPMYSATLGDGRWLLAADLTRGDGYQDQTNLKRANVLARYSQGLGAGVASVRLQHYDADAEAPGYIQLGPVRSGALSPKTALSPGIGDDKKQTNLAFNYRSDDTDGQTGLDSGWTAAAYAVQDDRRRWVNFDPSTPPGSRVNLGAERDQLGQRGLDLRKATALGSTALPAQLLLGVQINREKIDAIHFLSDASRRTLGDASVDAERTVTTDTDAVFGELQISPVKGLKLQAGLRHDRIAFGIDLKSLDDAFGGPDGNRFRNTKRQTSPKLGLAFALVDGAATAELFANAARGLKSPYPYGDYTRLPASNITQLTSYEVGLQSSAPAGSWRVALWRTEQDKEALFDAANRFIGNQKTDRDGFEIEGRLVVSRDLRLAANYSAVKARLLGVGANDRITNVPDWTAGLGIEGSFAALGAIGDWSINDTIVGPKPLAADNSTKTSTYNRITARVAFVPDALKPAKFALSTTYYDKPYEETVFGTRVSAKPRWKALATAQYSF